MTTPSPYWTAYAAALPEQGSTTLPNGDVRRLVELLDAVGAQVERAKADAEHEAYLRRCAEVERNRLQRELDRLNT